MNLVGFIDMKTGFPIYQKNKNTGEKGVNAVSNIVNDDFQWIFRRNSNEYDFGIDGYVDVISKDGAVTGQCFAVQIKSGQSFFKQKTSHGFVYYGDQKHLNYYLNISTPVLLIIYDDVENNTYWQHFNKASVEGTENGWKVEIPFGNLLSQAKERLLQIIGPPEDHIDALKLHWAFNEELAQYDFIHYSVDRHDVETQNVSNIIEFFQRIESSDSLCRKFQGRIEISISGYDADTRELWEVKKAVSWFKKAHPHINWFFFSYLGSKSRGFKCYLACMCNARRAKGKKNKGRHLNILVELELKHYPFIIESNFMKLNEMTDRLGLPEDENKRISFEAIEIMSIPMPKQGDRDA
jgi:hypothetical protein